MVCLLSTQEQKSATVSQPKPLRRKHNVYQSVRCLSLIHISQAGHQAGIIKGETRSGLLYEVERLLSVAAEHEELPKYLILENVKNLVGKKFIKQFEAWLSWLDELGYNSYWQVINAKDCGIPQNRERVFAVSIRKDIDNGFAFPQPQTLQCSMDDFLEENVEEKYFLSDAFLKDAEERSIRMAAVSYTHLDVYKRQD